MSAIFVVAFVIALAATTRSQCIYSAFKCKGGNNDNNNINTPDSDSSGNVPPIIWLEEMQQSRVNALAQEMLSKMSPTKIQMMVCGCCCATTPCISSEICSCAVEECYAHILGKKFNALKHC